MECPICFNVITNSCVGSCTHHFCMQCLIRWCYFGGIDCPICKTPIIDIRRDKEFDSLNNPSGNGPITLTNIGDVITIKFNKNDSAGITLENNYTLLGLGRAPGVFISKINDKDKCYAAGMRKNDILLFINNIPCVDHKQCVNIVNNCVMANASLTCTVLKIRSI